MMDYNAVSEKIKSAPLRSTFGYAATAWEQFYGRVEKGNSGILKLGLQLGNGIIAQPIVKKSLATVVKVSDPWVDTLDKTLSQTWDKVEKKVLDPSRKHDSKGAVTVGGVTAFVRSEASAKFTKVTNETSIQLNNRYSALLDLSDSVIDTWMPEPSEEVPVQANQLTVSEKAKKVRSKAQRRVFKRLEKKFQTVRTFSSGPLKNVIHIDLVVYAETNGPVFVDHVKEHASVYLTKAQEKSSVYYTRITAQVKAAREFVYARYQLLSKQFLQFRSLSETNAAKAYKLVVDQADAYGVPQILNKAKEIRLADVSDYVLVKLREGSQEFVLVEQRFVDVFTSLFAVLISKNKTAGPAHAPAQAAPSQVEAH